MHETIYSQIAAIAAPIVAHYTTDVSVHDRNALRSFQIGDVAIWSPRECGSHFCRLAFSGNLTIADRLNATRANRDWFEAAVKVFEPAQWYLLESTSGQRGTVRPISVGAARKLYAEKIRDLEIGLQPKRCLNVLGGWQTELGDGTLTGPVFNSIVNLWDWQRQNFS